MSKKIIAIVLELIPVISAVVSFYLFNTSKDSALIRRTLLISFLLALLGIVFFFVGRSLGKGDKTVKILGIFDIFATVSVIAIYILAFLAMAM